MARYRPTPTCPYCGAVTATAINKKIKPGITFIGDTFIRWEKNGHTCKGKREAEKKMKKEIDKIWDDIKKSGRKLPPFMNPSTK